MACAWVSAWKVNGFYSQREPFFPLSRTIQMSNAYGGRCKKLPFESLTLKAISILLELLDICWVPQTWQVSEGDKMPRGLYKTQPSSPHLQCWAAAAIGMQRSFQEFFLKSYFKNTDPWNFANTQVTSMKETFNRIGQLESIAFKLFWNRLCASFPVSISPVKRQPYTLTHHHFDITLAVSSSRLTLVLVCHSGSVQSWTRTAKVARPDLL